MFKKNDIVCFLGDSITAKGLWMAEVYQSIRKTCAVKCYNCGVSGITATKTSAIGPPMKNAIESEKMSIRGLLIAVRIIIMYAI